MRFINGGKNSFASMISLLRKFHLLIHRGISSGILIGKIYTFVNHRGRKNGGMNEKGEVE